MDGSDANYNLNYNSNSNYNIILNIKFNAVSFCATNCGSLGALEQSKTPDGEPSGVCLIFWNSAFPDQLEFEACNIMLGNFLDKNIVHENM